MKASSLASLAATSSSTHHPFSADLRNAINAYGQSKISSKALFWAVLYDFRSRYYPHVLELDTRMINSLLDSTDCFVRKLFHEYDFAFPGLRFQLRLNCFKQVFSVGFHSWRQRFQLLLDHPDFDGKSQLVCELSRIRIEQELKRIYGCSPSRSINRITRSDISMLSQGDYVSHCLSILNLERPISNAQKVEISNILTRIACDSAWSSRLERSVKRRLPSKYFLCDFLVSALNIRANHNTHPASEILCILTGFVFHPNDRDSCLTLTSEHFSGSFINVGNLLCRNFLNSVDVDDVSGFFEKAFVRQDPCFEATVENLLSWRPESSPLIAPPRPIWSSHCDWEENVNALFDWYERILLEKYALDYGISVAIGDFASVEILLQSEEFCAFLRTQIERACKTLISYCQGGSYERLFALAQTKWGIVS